MLRATLPFCLLVCAAVPVSAAAPSPDEIAFGFAPLKWGMTEQEARGLFPKLDGLPMAPGQPDATMSLADVALGGCRFTASLEFERGRLAALTLDSNGIAHLKECGAKIKPALARQYGGEPGGFSPGPNPHGYSEYGAWRGPVTEVTYAALEGGFITLRFARTPSR